MFRFASFKALGLNVTYVTGDTTFEMKQSISNIPYIIYVHLFDGISIIVNFNNQEL